MTSSDRHRFHFPSFFSNPFVGLIGSFFSVISVILAIYFYTQGSRTPCLTYFVHPIKAVVVKSGQSSNLSIAYNGIPITSDIIVAQIVFWNQGTSSLKRANILKPFVLYTESHTPILEATIRSISRDVTNIHLDTSELQNGRLPVSWDILEHNDGAVIQIIYAGQLNSTILSEGVFEGQPLVEYFDLGTFSIDTNRGLFNFRPSYVFIVGKWLRIYFLGLLIMLGSIVGIFGTMVSLIETPKGKCRAWIRQYWYIPFLFFTTFLIGLILFIWAGRHRAPFTF